MDLCGVRKAWLGVEGVKSGKIKTMTTFNSEGLKLRGGCFFLSKIVKHS